MSSGISQKFNPFTLLKFAFPSMVMLVFMSIYTIADGMFVSRFLGDGALSAVNIVYPVIFLANGFGVMLGTGGSAMIAKQLGEGKQKKACEDFTFYTCFGIFIGVLLLALTFLFVHPIILGLGSSESLVANCKAYLLPLILFAPITILQLMFQCLFATAGKPQYGLILTTVGGILNIMLDYIFLGPLQMGIMGAAIATGIGQSIPAIFGLIYFAFVRKELYFVPFHPDFKSLAQACFNGSSEMVTSLSNAVVTFLFNVIMLKLAGESGVAAITIILYGQFLFNSLYLGFAIGVAPVISYNYGSKDHVQLQRVTKICYTFLLISSVLITLISFLSSDYVVSVFVGEKNDTYALASTGFSIFAINFLFGGINIFTSSLFTALSDGKRSALLSFLRTFFITVVALLVLPNHLGITGVWLAVPLAEAITCLVSVFLLFGQNQQYHYFR